MWTHKTSDIMLASFLLANWLIFKKIENTDIEKRRCTFVLTTPEWIDLIDLLSQRWSSTSDYAKILLRKNKELKTELNKYQQIFRM